MIGAVAIQGIALEQRTIRLSVFSILLFLKGIIASISTVYEAVIDNREQCK